MLSERDTQQETARTIDGASIDYTMLPPRINPGLGALAAAPEGEDADFSDRDASGEELYEDAEGEEDNDYLMTEPAPPFRNQVHDQVDIEEGDEDAEGEEYDDEAVGAVKFKPGELQDEDESESEASAVPSAIEDESEEEDDEEGEAAWEEAGASDDEDKDSEAIVSNTCMFCKQDEENDPSEDFEAFLSCRGCSENGATPNSTCKLVLTFPAHQQCARDAAAMSEQNSKW